MKKGRFKEWLNMNKGKIKGIIIKTLRLITNPRFLLCFGLAWIITNGWAYAMLGLSAVFKIGWMAAVSGTYLTIIWFPFTPEKIITTALSIFLLQKIFPNDEKTLAVLKKLYADLKFKAKTKKEKRQAEKNDNNNEGTQHQ